jgi:hypothetical protein
MANKFFQEVIAEEDAICNERETIRTKIRALETEITTLKKNDVFYYRPRKYCKFSDGYHCKFEGDCSHKGEVDDITKMFGIRCFAEKHARDELK